MKETIIQYVNQYLPALFELLLGSILAFGMKKITDSFESKIGSQINAEKLAGELKKTRDELRSVTEELKDCTSAMIRLEENISRIRSRFIPYYNEHNADFSTPYPGIPEMLQTLHNQGIILAVASNKYQAATEKLIAPYFPTIPFVKVLGQRDGIPVKPNPTIVFDILKEVNITKEEVLYVGDSGVDMQTALNANVEAIGVAWGFRSRTELEPFNPLAIINRAEELLEFI